MLSIAVLVAGCGGGGANGESNQTGTSAGNSGEISKAKYIREADATCAADNRKIKRKLAFYLKNAQGRSAKAVATTMVNKVLAVDLMDEIRSVRALVLPTKDIERVAFFLNALQAVLERAEKDPLAFTHAAGPFAESERLGKQYGFAICGGL